MNSLSSLRFGLVFLVCVCFVLGCKPSDGVKKLPVSGNVTVDGQAVTSGQVTLHPQSTEKGAGSAVSGPIDSSGKYTIGGGAPAGKYKATVTPSMMPSPDGKPPTSPYNAKFGDSKKTPLEIEVVASPAAGAYDL